MPKNKTVAPIVLEVRPDQVQLLTIPEVARRLRVSRMQVYRLIKRRGLPALTVGEHFRVSILPLQRWIEQQEEISQEEIS